MPENIVNILDSIAAVRGQEYVEGGAGGYGKYPSTQSLPQASPADAGLRKEENIWQDPE